MQNGRVVHIRELVVNNQSNTSEEMGDRWFHYQKCHSKGVGLECCRK